MSALQAHVHIDLFSSLLRSFLDLLTTLIRFSVYGPVHEISVATPLVTCVAIYN